MPNHHIKDVGEETFASKFIATTAYFRKVTTDLEGIILVQFTN